MAGQLQSSQADRVEVLAVRARHIGLRFASDDRGWKSSSLGEARSRNYIASLVRGGEYVSPSFSLALHQEERRCSTERVVFVVER